VPVPAPATAPPRPSLCQLVAKGKGAGIGQGPYLAVGVRIQDTGPPPPAAIIYTLWPVIFTVYIYRVITVSREQKGRPPAGPVSLFPNLPPAGRTDLRSKS
jgi:hypothetical protein